MLHDKALPNNPKYDGYQRVLVSMAHKVIDKKSSGGGIKRNVTPN